MAGISRSDYANDAGIAILTTANRSREATSTLERSKAAPYWEMFTVGQLEGRNALVTGAGMGIGQGIAFELAKQGARIVLHYGGSRAGAEEAAAQIVASGGVAHAVQGDLRIVAECNKVVDETISLLGGLDILVNNAGVTRAQGFLETTETLYDEMFDLNIKGYFFCAQRALPTMLKGGHGAIINISSVHGFGGAASHAAYAGTKGAISAFTRSLAIELAPQGVRVNAIGPGVVEVPRYFNDPNYTREKGESMVPMLRVGTPEDIGQTVAFLVSDAASWITGQTLYVDGGTTAKMGINNPMVLQKQ
jgi:NAD(P)-dependent dehydrogenase (short-subunit alcohol dehydrogenase family)